MIDKILIYKCDLGMSESVFCSKYGGIHRVDEKISNKLEYLRKELRAERISYDELAELQSLVEYIAPGDVELLEAARVTENI